MPNKPMMLNEFVELIKSEYIDFIYWKREFIRHSSSVISHRFKRRNEIV